MTKYILKQENGFKHILFRPKNSNEKPDQEKYLEVSNDDYRKLVTHKLMWATKEVEVVEPIYEAQTIQVETDEDNLDNPIYNENNEIVGYKKRIKEQTIQVEKGKKNVIKKEYYLVPNPNYEQYIVQRKNEIEMLKEKSKIRNQIFAYRVELNKIKKWFNDNDWKVNKVVIGEWQETDARWLEYVTERKNKRARQDEINALIKQLIQN